MTLTQLLAANPGVELTLAYNETLGVYSVMATSREITFNTVILKRAEDKEPGRFEEAIKRAMGAVK